VAWKLSQPCFMICRPAFRLLHRSPHGPSYLPSILGRTSRLPAEHPSDGQKIKPGRVYVAPPDFHLLVGDGVIRLSQGPKERYNRPAIDALFISAAQVYGQRVVGVLLTGTSSDGVAGLKEIKSQGGLVIVQDPAEAMFSELPLNALAKVEVDYCLPVTKIRELLIRLPPPRNSPMDTALGPASSTPRDLVAQTISVVRTQKTISSDQTVPGHAALHLAIDGCGDAIKLRALDDPDLEPLWDSLRQP